MILCAKLRQPSAAPSFLAANETASMSSIPTVFARSVRKVADAVAAHGNADLLLRTVGLDREAIDDPTLRIPYADMIMLSEHAARMTKDAAFGLHVGEREKPQSYGVVGYSIMTSSTVEEALCSQARYLPVWTNVGNFRLDVDGPVAHFQWEYSAVPLPESRHDCEMSMATVTQFLRLLTCARWQPREVWFRHRKPKDTSEHARIFRAPVRFAMPTNALLFDRRLLSTPIRSANPHAHQVITAVATQMAARASGGPTFSQAVISLIRQRMNTGDLGLEAVSQHLAVSQRTLQRRLSEEATSYRKLIHQARQELARFLLSSLGATTVETAYALGFSDPSAFYHAFRDWFGTSPRAHRRTAPIQ
jgi:AraC-like DNA-binding protein